MTGDVESNTVFGASACIAFRFDGTLEQLAEKLADALNLKSFDIETNQNPPHKMIGSAEALGWEIWLEEDLEESPHCFRLRMQTEHSLKEEFDGDMHDLSPWLAKLVSMLINVDALPSIDADSGRSSRAQNSCVPCSLLQSIRWSDAVFPRSQAPLSSGRGPLVAKLRFVAAGLP